MKVAVIHVKAGAGHFKAAEAIYYGIKEHTEHDVQLVDALDYTHPIFKKAYAGIYTIMITYGPWLWGFVFSVINIPCLQWLICKFRRCYNFLNAYRLHRFLVCHNFDYIIMTHFLPTEVAASLKRRGKIKARLITCITDFDVHRIWLAEGIDLYCVASEWTKDKSKRLGIESSKIVVTGIPTHEKFSACHDDKAIKKKLGLGQEKFIVLVATGSFGIGPIEDIIKILKDLCVIVVCGHNKKRYKDLKAKGYPNAKILGLVDNMDELMSIADVMVTKPGGISIAEALVMGLPLFFFNAIPGQEEGNIQVLKEYDVGVSVCPIAGIKEELDYLRKSLETYEKSTAKIKKIAKPSSVNSVIKLIQ